jgi:hypothetical protein
MFASLRYLNSSVKTCSLCFEIFFFTIEHVRFASLDSQFNINLLCFASIFKFFNINMFASLQNKLSNYSLRFEINFQTIERVCFPSVRKKHHYRSFRSLSFASISMPLKGHSNEADFSNFLLDVEF